MKPYCEIDGITVYHGDCLDIPQWIIAADILITDPPYGMKYESGQPRGVDKHRGTIRGRFDRIVGDDTTAARDDAIELWRNHDPWEPIRPAAVFGTWKQPRPDNVANVLIWHKQTSVGMGDTRAPFGMNHEEIYLLGEWTKPETFRRRGSVISTSEHPQRTAELSAHPTPKPVGLLEVLIAATPAGAVIADPFAGGGSTLVAARNQGRKAVGVEIDERYCETIARRLDQMVLGFDA